MISSQSKIAKEGPYLLFLHKLNNQTGRLRRNRYKINLKFTYERRKSFFNFLKTQYNTLIVSEAFKQQTHLSRGAERVIHTNNHLKILLVYCCLYHLIRGAINSLLFKL